MFISLTETNSASEYPNAPFRSFVFNDFSIDDGGSFVSGFLVALAVILVDCLQKSLSIVEIICYTVCLSPLYLRLIYLSKICARSTVKSNSDGILQISSALQNYASIFGEIDKVGTVIIIRSSDYLEPYKSQLLKWYSFAIAQSGSGSCYADRDTDTLSNGLAGDRLFANKEGVIIEGVECNGYCVW